MIIFKIRFSEAKGNLEEKIKKMTGPGLGLKRKGKQKKLAALSMLHKAKKAYYACDLIRFLVP